MRTVIALIRVDDDKAIAEDLGTIEYLEREFGWLVDSGVFFCKMHEFLMTMMSMMQKRLN